jgi:Ca-activated chloride channel family protein
MITFAHPLWLALLIALPPLGWWIARGGGRMSLPESARIAGANGRGAKWLGLVPLALRLLVLALLIVALAGPRTAAGIATEPVAGVPMVVAIDISSSMLARDWSCPAAGCGAGGLPRDRLEAAKLTLADFISARENDPVGLVAFAAEALTLVPITLHQPLLLQSLQTLRVGLITDGTAIGEGLATAVNRVRHAPGESRVVILMSDGASNRGEIDPMVAARAAEALGVTVHTIGVGSTNAAVRAVGAVPPDSARAESTVGLDESLLRQIAEVTGGAYFRATDSRALASVYARIDRMEKGSVDAQRTVEYDEWYRWMLTAAALLLAVEWSLRGSRWGAVP